MKKFICLALLAALFLFANSCHDEVEVDSELTLKSGKLKKDVVAEMKSWYENNPDANKFVILEYAEEVRWASAQIMEINNLIVTEVKVKLKGKYKVMSQKDPSLNFDHRLLFIKEDGKVTLYMEYFVSKKDPVYLQDTEKVSYLTRDGSFEGSVVLENSKNELSTIYHSTGNSQELRLKNVEYTCYELVENFSDGSNRIIANWGCVGDSGSSSSQTPTPPTTPSGSAHGGTTSNPAPVVNADNLKASQKADCIYQKLLNGGTLRNFISRYFAVSPSSQSYLGELNLTWKLDVLSNNVNGITLPIGYSGNSSYKSVEIELNEATMDSRSSTAVAMTMLHEALHAKLIAEYYDSVGSTDFHRLFAYYKGWGTGEMNTNQQMEMLNLYAGDMASALQSFDQVSGISQPLSVYTEALKFQLSVDILGHSLYPAGSSSYDLLKNSSKNCY